MWFTIFFWSVGPSIQKSCCSEIVYSCCVNFSNKAAARTFGLTSRWHWDGFWRNTSKMWNGLMWFRAGTSDRLLWTRWWNTVSYKRLHCYELLSKEPFSGCYDTGSVCPNRIALVPRPNRYSNAVWFAKLALLLEQNWTRLHSVVWM
jgi:hypothetical protein